MSPHSSNFRHLSKFPPASGRGRRASMNATVSVPSFKRWSAFCRKFRTPAACVSLRWPACNLVSSTAFCLLRTARNGRGLWRINPVFRKWSRLPTQRGARPSTSLCRRPFWMCRRMVTHGAQAQLSRDRSTLSVDDPTVGRALFAWSRLRSVDLERGLSQVTADILPFIWEGRLAA